MKRSLLVLSLVLILSSCYESSTETVSNSEAMPLFRTESELPGVNCPEGGVVYILGLDRNNNGLLEDSEITSRRYECYPQGDANEAPSILIADSVEFSYRKTLALPFRVLDIEGDSVSLNWLVLSAPVGGELTIVEKAYPSVVNVSASVPGKYLMQVQASDGHNTTTVNVHLEAINSLPSYSEIKLSPEAPTKLSTISANLIGLHDEDGDELYIEYFWSVNGLAVDGYASIVQGIELSKGDKIDVYARISDGHYTVETDPVSTTIVNSSPQYSSFGFVGGIVNSKDPIQVVVYNMVDADEDDIVVEYSWRINGEALAENQDTLPAGRVFLNDYIEVEAILSDGETETRTVTISRYVEEAPIDSVVSGLPAEISHKETLEFKVELFSADSGALKAQIAYGPSGMSINAAGKVTWTPNEIMFLPEETFYFGFKSTESDVIVSEHSIVVKDPNRKLPLARSGVEVPKFNHSIWIDDYDQDGKNEILLTDSDSRIFTLEFNGSEFRQKWMYPFFDSEGGKIVQLLSDDINGDGKPEIVVIRSHMVMIISDTTKIADVVYRLEKDDKALKAAAIGDLDRDGQKEIVLLSDSDLAVYQLTDWTLKFEKDLVGNATSVLIGNVDKDPNLEIITSSGYVFDGVTGVNKWYLPGGFGSKMAVGDVDDSGVDIIVGTDGWAKPKVYSALLKSEIWEIDETDICSLNIKNIDADPEQEILVGNCQWGDVVAYDVVSNTAVKKYSWDTVEHASISVTAGDVDNDGEIEVIWGSGITSSGEDVLVVGEKVPNRYTFHNENPSQLDSFIAAGWINITPQQSKAVFLVPRTDSGYSGQRIVEMDSEGNIEISDEISSNWSATSSGKVIDFDSDGYGELFFGVADIRDGSFQVRRLHDDTVIHGASGGDFNTNIGVVDAFKVNNDEYFDAVYTDRNKVIILDVKNQSILWNSTTFSSSILDVNVFKTKEDEVVRVIVATVEDLSIWKSQGSFFIREFAYNQDCQRVLVNSTNNVVCLVSNQSYSDSDSKIVVFDSELVPISAFELPLKVTDMAWELGSESNLLISTQVLGLDYWSAKNTSLKIFSLEGKMIWESLELMGEIPARSLFYLPDMQGQNRRVTFASRDAMFISR